MFRLSLSAFQPPVLFILFHVVFVVFVYGRNGPYGTCIENVDCKPPMGWRNWNVVKLEINQTMMMRSIDAMVKVRDSKGRSFKSLGYVNAGLDDNWQACGQGVNGGFHDKNGIPMINKERFPDLKEMVDYGKSKNLTMGWYVNNCWCGENTKTYLHNGFNLTLEDIYREDARAGIYRYGFQAMKLDHCGPLEDVQKFSDYFDKFYTELKSKNETSPNVGGIMIENGHIGWLIPSMEWCPWSMYRISNDIAKDDWEMWRNFQTMFDFSVDYYSGTLKSIDGLNNTLSRPGCWSYPDSLEVGNLHSFNEERTHFGAWVITSSPLILGHDITNEDDNERIWDFVANEELIAVNQAWVGHPGTRLYKDTLHLRQVWGKLVSKNQIAVFHIHAELYVNSVGMRFVDPDIESMSIRCLYEKKDIKTLKFNVSFHPHALGFRDSHFFLITFESKTRDFDRNPIKYSDLKFEHTWAGTQSNIPSAEQVVYV